MYRPHAWTPAQDDMLATLSPSEIQRLTGRSLKAIGNRRVKLKRKGVNLPDLRTSERGRGSARQSGIRRSLDYLTKLRKRLDA